MKNFLKANKEYFQYLLKDFKPYLIYDSKKNKYFVTILFSRQMINTFQNFEIIK